MEFFCKGDNHCHEQKNIQDVMDEIQGAIPHLVIEDLKPIQVKAGSKLRNVVPVVINQCKSTGNGSLSVIVGGGAAVSKVISLSEMVSV